MLNRKERLFLVYVIPTLLGISFSLTASLGFIINEKDREIRDLKSELELINNFYDESKVLSNGELRDGRGEEKDGQRRD